jgi:hypothetical protein
MLTKTNVNDYIYRFFDNSNRFMISIRNHIACFLRWPADILHQIWLTRVSLVSVVAGALLMLTTQARDVFADQTFTIRVQIEFYCFVFLFWAVPVHYTARMALDRNDPSRDVPFSFTRFWPRCLGLSTVAIVAYASVLASSYLDKIIGLEEAVSASHRIKETYWSASGAAILFVAYAIFHRWGTNINRDAIKRRSVVSNSTQQFTTWDTVWSALPLVYTLVTVSLFIWAVSNPFNFSSSLHRLFLFPVMLGGWLPIVGYFATISNNARFPILSFLLVLIIFIGSLAEHHNDIRIIPTSTIITESSSQRQGVLQEAIDHWKMVNCTASSCPRPILVAAEGGASRAAFHAATVIGAAGCNKWRRQVS